MSTSISLEDIYKRFQKSQEKLDCIAIEANRRAVEANRRTVEADNHLYKLVQESQEELNCPAIEAERHAVEAERRTAQADLRAAQAAHRAAERSLAELTKTVERTSRAVDALTTSWGRFVEELVEPAMLQLFQSRGIDVKEVHPRLRTKRQGLAMEIDILAVDDTELVIVECKPRLFKDDVDEFLEKLARFKQSFPHYNNYQAYGAVARIEINEAIDRYAAKKGLFVIKPSGETVAIANEPNFQAATW